MGGNDVARITSRVITVETPNNNSLSSSWGNYRTSVDKIEAATGPGLLSALSPDLQGSIEARTDAGPAN
jgi:endonuclease G